MASSGHVSTLAIAKVRQNALCCLVLIFQRTIWLDFPKGYRRLQAQCHVSTPNQNALCCLVLIFQRTIWLDFPPSSPCQTFQTKSVPALIKMATVWVSQLLWNVLSTTGFSKRLSTVTPHPPAKLSSPKLL